MTTKTRNRLSQDYQSSPRFTFRRLPSVASGKQYYEDHDGVLNWAGSTLAVPHFGPVNGVHLRLQSESSYSATLLNCSRIGDGSLSYFTKLGEPDGRHRPRSQSMTKRMRMDRTNSGARPKSRGASVSRVRAAREPRVRYRGVGRLSGGLMVGDQDVPNAVPFIAAASRTR